MANLGHHSCRHEFPQDLLRRPFDCRSYSDINDTAHTVTATYAAYGSTPTPPSIPSADGAAVAATNGPGSFPNKKVLAANFDASVAADGMGYPPDIIQSNQGAPQQIVWNSSGFGGVA